MSEVRAQVTIQGTRPLLWNHFGPEAIPLETRERTGKAGNDPSEWQRSVLKTKQGQLYLEPSAMFACLRGGAKFTPRKRGTLQPLVAATVQVSGDMLLVDRSVPAELKPAQASEEQLVYIDVRTVRNPATGGRNVRYRVATAPGWRLEFRLSWDSTVISPGEMEAVLRDAGKFVGLGDGRSIGFGRFVVECFRKEEKDHAKKQTTKRGMGRRAEKGVNA